MLFLTPRLPSKPCRPLFKEHYNILFSEFKVKKNLETDAFPQ